MARRTKRQRVNSTGAHVFNPPASRAYPNDPLCPTTQQDQQTWKGFCEIESEPAFFNVMLREWGVKGVKVQEVIGLDDEILAALPKLVYGLVFLFRWRGGPDDDEEESCPDEVWFANQTSANSCASVALLNIINNVPGIDLGDNLTSFKQFTKDFTPALRGYQVDHFEFVKNIHNSFARKMDMLEADLHLKENATAANAGKRKSDDNDSDCDETSRCYHFIAYVPVAGQVWSLDGLQRKPVARGEIKQNQPWLETARPFIQERMMAYSSDDIEFNLLALVQDPLVSLRADLAQNIKSLNGLEARLTELQATWRDALPRANLDEIAEEGFDVDGYLSGPSKVYSITRDLLRQTSPLPSANEVLQSTDLDVLLATRHRIIGSQSDIRAAIFAEHELNRADKVRTINRRWDYGPFIRKWLQILIANGTFEQIFAGEQEKKKEAAAAQRAAKAAERQPVKKNAPAKTAKTTTRAKKPTAPPLEDPTPAPTPTRVSPRTRKASGKTQPPPPPSPRPKRAAKTQGVKQRRGKNAESEAEGGGDGGDSGDAGAGDGGDAGAGGAGDSGDSGASGAGDAGDAGDAGAGGAGDDEGDGDFTTETTAAAGKAKKKGPAANKRKRGKGKTK